MVLRTDGLFQNEAFHQYSLWPFAHLGYFRHMVYSYIVIPKM